MPNDSLSVFPQEILDRESSQLGLTPYRYKQLDSMMTLFEDQKEDENDRVQYFQEFVNNFRGQPDPPKQDALPVVNAELTLPGEFGFGDFVNGIGELFDYYGAAPVRNVMYGYLTADEGKNKTWAGLKEAAKGMFRRPQEGPTGKDVALAGGVPEQGMDPWQPQDEVNYSAADVVGTIIDFGFDWTNVVPGKTLGKLFFGAANKAAPVTKTLAKTADVVTGTNLPTTTRNAWEQTLKAGKEGLEEGMAQVPVKTWDESRGIAQKLGIPEGQLPASVKYGEESTMSLFERYKREGPTGQKLREWWKDGAGKLEKGITGEVNKLGTPRNMADAGAQMEGMFDKGVKTYFDQFAITNNNIIKGYPGLKVNEGAWKKLDANLRGMERWAAGRAKRGVSATQKSQATEVLNAVEAIRNSKGSYKQTYEALQMIGEVAFERAPLSAIPADTKKMRNIYFKIRNAMEETIKADVKGGEALIEPLRKNNAKMAGMFKDKAVIGDMILNPKMGSEKKLAQIFGDTRKIKALKTFLEPGDMNKLKASYLENQIIQRGTDGEIKWLGLSNRLRTAKRRGLINELFDGGEMDAINDYIRLAHRFGEDVLSRSGTGATNQFSDYLKNLAGRMGEEAVVNPLREVATSPGPQTSLFIPMVKTPKEYIKTAGSRAKALQTYSQMGMAKRRKEERRLIGNYYEVDLMSAPWDLVDRLIKGTKEMNAMKNQKRKRARKKQLENMIKKETGAKRSLTHPKPGTVKDGYSFKGGDASLEENWTKV